MDARAAKPWLTHSSSKPYLFTIPANTSDNNNDYDAICPYSGSIAPDVVYSFTPTADVVVDIDLCGSGYDTKVYIMDQAMNLIDCNDDAYFNDDPCGHYVSKIVAAQLPGGIEYFIIIDGYGEDAGDYIISVSEGEIPEYCDLPCYGWSEGEPSITGDYIDHFNGGCNSDPAIFGDYLFANDHNCEFLLCGNAGWNDWGRDTDWFHIMIGDEGLATWTADAQSPTHCFKLGGGIFDCVDVVVEDSMLVGPCGSPGTMTIQGNPGEVILLWIGSSNFSNPDHSLPWEYRYANSFTGVGYCGCPTEKISFDAVKSLYR